MERDAVKDLSHAAGRGRNQSPRPWISALPFLPEPVPKIDLSRVSEDPWKGDPAKAQKLLQRRFDYGGVELTLDTQDTPWDHGMATPQWMREVQGFSWLRDLASAEDGATAAKLGRLYLVRWMRAGKRLPSLARHPDVAGERIALWLRYGEWLLDHAQPAFRRHFLSRLSRDIRQHRRRVEALGERAGLGALKGLAVAYSAIPGGKNGLVRMEPALHDSIRARITEDGGHVSRCPEQQLASLRQLVEIRGLFKQVAELEDDTLDTVIHRMAGMLRMWLHGDGRLALFNDTLEGDENSIRATLDKTGGFLSIPRDARATGFQRLAMKDSIVIMDAGVPQRTHSRTHFGTLSFEFSHMQERIVVNCGAFRGGDARWREASRKTAAHSTLIVNQRDSVPSLPQELLSLSYTPAVIVEHAETPSSIEVTGTYNGYAPDFQLLHRRRLVLCENGKRLEGEDSLLSAGEKEAPLSGLLTAALRFHLHPDVRATKTEEGAIQLRTPSGRQWVFSCNGIAATLQESIYLGRSGKPKTAHQLVVELENLQAGMKVSWLFEQRK